MTQRDNRTELIRELVRKEQVKTQGELAELLAARGLVLTQATISRYATNIGLKKDPRSGKYVLPEDVFVRRMVSELVTEVIPAQNLVVVKSSSGAAQGVAAALDGVEIEGIVGSIAGDDTILLIAPDNATAQTVAAAIRSFMV
ncbi:MAG: ArgR family transcriptional regulator [Coriobacteriales bacterium]|nr:ArgR family transcriptional regulator [Coriobacteriales bacterium]